MKVYVGTYAKYNNGITDGKEMDLEDYENKDEFMQACRERHADEEDPEFMFLDWEDVSDKLISESHIDPQVWECLKAYDRHGIDAVNAYIECFDEWDEDGFQDRYRGHFNSLAELLEEFMEETGQLDCIPEQYRMYFDFDALAKDVEANGEMVEHEGHFFSR
jgi:antirestriction protein